MRKFLPILLIVFLLFPLSCAVNAHKEKDTPTDPSTPATATPLVLPSTQGSSTPDVNGKFAIIEPKNGQQVGTNVITVRGAGAKPGDKIRIEVMTNDWYLQDGREQIGEDGSWKYSPCHLNGKGNYRLHHSIKAELIRNGKVVATSTVEEVKAP